MDAEDMDREAMAAAYAAMEANGQTGLVTNSGGIGRPCPHYAAVVDVPARAFNCRACGKALDPYHWMAGMADTWTAWARAISTQRQESHSLKVATRGKQAELRSLDAKIARRRAALKKLA